MNWKQQDVNVKIILAVNGQGSERIAGILRSRVNGYTKIVTCTKQGKACAINNALRHVETEWFGVIDSDCELRDVCSLKILCDSITDRTIAVGGCLTIRRKWNPITWIQDMEYKRTFLHRRQVSRDIGSVTLISGALVSLRKI